MQKVDPRDRRCRVANRAMRMVFQLVSGRQPWRGKGVDREFPLWKLREFHRSHKTPLEQAVADMHQAYKWLPESCYEAEAKPLVALAKKRRRGPVSIGELLIPLLIRMGAIRLEDVENSKSGEVLESPLNSNTSEARNSD